VQHGQGPRPFDVTTRLLLDVDPASWLRWVGLPVDGPVHPVESDTSTVLAEVDKALRIEAAAPWLAHFEIQSSRDPGLPLRLLQYHALLLHKYREPVSSTVVLLRPDADGAEMSGLLERHDHTGQRTIAFNYRVVRLWERPVEELLQGGLGTLPLAPIAAVAPNQLPEVIARVDDRITQEAEPDLAGELRTATGILLGLRYDVQQIRALLRGVRQMRESVFYQEIVNEGRVEGRLEEARSMLVQTGTPKFGPPPPAIVARLESMTDITALEALARRMWAAESWDDLLGPKTTP
jgi:predicted transposase YdaD